MRFSTWSSESKLMSALKELFNILSASCFQAIKPCQPMICSKSSHKNILVIICIGLALFPLKLDTQTLAHHQVPGINVLEEPFNPLSNFRWHYSLKTQTFNHLPAKSKEIEVKACQAAVVSWQEAEVLVPEDAIPISTKLEVQFEANAALLHPLPPSIVNATKAAGVIRLKPATFPHEGQLIVSVIIDKEYHQNWWQIRDLKGFYFDQIQKSWKSVALHDWDEQNHRAYFLTDPFAEFIAGIIQSPEHPTTAAFVQTEIKDFQAPKPDAGIKQIEAPKANNMGSAHLNYPLQLPPGRLGMEPNLQVSYNSNGGNGWMGMGWQLAVPSISIDTRWGVPLYDESLETETYLYQGEQLYPVANRKELVPRQARKYHPRIEGAFAQIIRHGDSPKDYWWEVIEKDGQRSFYGGTPEQKQMDKAVLKTSSDEIAEWFLVERRDPNGNFIRYTYTYQEDRGPNGNHSLGYNRYLDRISYTGHGGIEGRFHIKFLRDQQLEEQRRSDAYVSATLGFKKVVASLLRRIEIRMDEELIRSYSFDYQDGVFNKKLLTKIHHLDSEGNIFNTHELDYFNDTKIEGRFTPLAEPQNSQFQFDNLKGPLTSSILGFQNEPSFLGGNRANNGSLGIAVTVGGPGKTFFKNNTGGGHYTFTQTKARGINTLLDINGDGLGDKVFVMEGELYFRPNLGVINDQLQFGTREKIMSGRVDQFSFSRTRNHSYGGEVNLKLGGLQAYASTSTTKSKTVTPVYFQDFNADGLIDIAFNRIVFFNRLDEEGIPQFIPTSNGTPNPIVDGVPIDDELMLEPQLDEEELSFEEENPLHDAVKVWIAPYSSRNRNLRIRGQVQLKQDTSLEARAYDSKDGVRVSIEHDNEFIFREVIEEEYFETIPFDTLISDFDKGDMFFFRVHSQYDGAYDQTAWDISICYVDEDTGQPLEDIDPNGHPLFAYHSSSDFLLTAPQEIGMPMTGAVTIEGEYQIAPLTDTLRLRIERRYKLDEEDEEDEEDQIEQLRSLVLLPGQASSGTIRLDEVEVKESDRLVFVASANSNVDWQAIHWQPIIEYNYRIDEDGEIEDLRDTSSNALWSIPAAVDKQMFNAIVKDEPQIIQLSSRDTFDIDLSIRYSLRQPQPPPPIPLQGYTEEGRIFVSVKGKEQLYASQEISRPRFFNGVWGVDLTIPAAIRNSNCMFIDIHFSDHEMYEYFKENYHERVFLDDDITTRFNIYTTLPDELKPVGNLYRSWGQFSYLAEGEMGANPIREGLVRDALGEYRDVDFDYSSDNPDDIRDDLDPTRKEVGIMYASMGDTLWQGYDNNIYVNQDLISSSRLGEDNNSVRIDEENGTGLSTPVKVNRTRSKAKSGSITYSIGLPGADTLQPRLSASNSTTNSWQSIDIVDLNKDGYPDLTANGITQVTNQRGGRSSKIIRHGYNSHFASSKKSGFTGGGSLQQASLPNTFSNSSSVTFSSNSASLSQNFALGGQASVGVSGFLDRNEDKTDGSWLDVTGDELPDLVQEDGKIRLNYGYHFGPLENWNNIKVREGESQTEGASVSLTSALPSINRVNGSWTLGISLSKSNNHSTYGHQDVTGDGMNDILTVSEEGHLYVQINLGQQYSDPVLWKEDFLLDEGEAVSESVNGAFTICINFVFVRLCLNPKGYIGRSVNRPLTKIMDIDGDGYPDFLKSSKEDQLSYSRSTIGRSNKLRKITRPLGSSVTLDYELIPPSYALPAAQWVMSTVSIHDSLTGDGADMQLFRHRYASGYKDRRERDLYGFQTVETEQLDTEQNGQVYRKYIYTYANDTYYRKGLLLSERMVDVQGNPYTSTSYTYELRNAMTGVVLPDNFAEDGASVFPARVQVDKAYYEGKNQPGIIYATEYDYDERGNITQYIDKGNGQLEDEVTARISYHQLAEAGIYSIPKRLEVVDYSGQLLRLRSCRVDEYGNLKQVRGHYENGAVAESDFHYDQYGNVVKVTRPANLHEERMWYQFTYDSEVNTYVTATIDAYNYSSSSSHNYQYGLPLETIDLNGQRIVREYDDKGRLTHLIGPYELAAGKPYTISMAYFTKAAIPYAICKHYDQEHDSDIFTITFIDGLGRPVQVKKSGQIFVSKQQEDTPVMIVSGKVIYDAFGREIRKYYPTTEPISQMEVYHTSNDQIDPIETTFDILDRALSSKLPDGSTTTTAFDLVEAPGAAGSMSFQTIKTDPLSNRADSYKDVRGRKVATVVYGPGDVPITTRYKYNGISELITVIDDAGNETNYAYDLLGRQTVIEHPVSGLTQLFYDPVGNLTKKITANIRDELGGEAGIQYEYDYERLVAIIYPLSYRNNVRYHYGKAGASFNRAGRIVLQEDASGMQAYFYGPLGETTKTIRTVISNQTDIRTYVSEARYDSWNRIQEIRYPDGERVQYEYNSAGKLTKLHGLRFGKAYSYVDRLSYDKFEKRRFIRFGNRSEQFYQYDPARQWLLQMSATSTTAGKFLDVHYTYDSVANVLSMSNEALPSANQLGGKYATYHSYDKLYRLKTSKGEWNRAGRTEEFFDTLHYDNTHNILSKIQHRLRDNQQVVIGSYSHPYEYDGTRPFTPSKIGESNYQYDPNGNLTEIRADRPHRVREFSWDEENRLESVLENGYLSRYTYDARGERVVKSHGPIQGQSINGSDNGFTNHKASITTYVSPYMVTRGNQFTKHYFIEGQRICSKIGQGIFNNNVARLGNGSLTAGDVDIVEHLNNIQLALLDFYGDSITPYYPSMPLFYAQPRQTGIPYPNLFPDSLEVQSTNTNEYVLPPQPDLSGNSQASFPAWRQEHVSADQARAGYGIVDSLSLPTEILQYFYHSDHLGSTAYITDRNGEISQFANYTPFGELFVEEQQLQEEGRQAYLFNGKELDRETGLYYYGARYYDPTASLWLSVDPMANKYPGWSPFNYTMQNPVKFVDPDGKQSELSISHKTSLYGYLETGFGIDSEAFKFKFYGKHKLDLASYRLDQNGLTWSNIFNQSLLDSYSSEVGGEFSFLGVGIGVKLYSSDQEMYDPEKSILLGPIEINLRKFEKSIAVNHSEQVDLYKKSVPGVYLKTGLGAGTSSKSASRSTIFDDQRTFYPDPPQNSNYPCPNCHNNTKPSRIRPPLLAPAWKQIGNGQ